MPHLVEDGVKREEPGARRDHFTQSLHAFIGWAPYRDLVRHLGPAVEGAEPLGEPLARAQAIRINRDVDALADREGVGVTAGVPQEPAQELDLVGELGGRQRARAHETAAEEDGAL